MGRGPASRVVAASVLTAALGLWLAGLAAQEAGPQPTPGPVPAASPSPTPSAEPLPRIIRVVCTDHICGNCDGKCHKGSGHVAVDKKGHCACTPTAGSALDLATRQAYEKNQPQ